MFRKVIKSQSMIITNLYIYQLFTFSWLCLVMLTDQLCLWIGICRPYMYAPASRLDMIVPRYTAMYWMIDGDIWACGFHWPRMCCMRWKTCHKLSHWIFYRPITWKLLFRLISVWPTPQGWTYFLDLYPRNLLRHQCPLHVAITLY